MHIKQESKHNPPAKAVKHSPWVPGKQDHKPMNPFLAPVHEILTNEWQSYSDLAWQVNAAIARGEINPGFHDYCSFSWFDELVETGHAERLYGSRNYFRRTQNA